MYEERAQQQINQAFTRLMSFEAVRVESRAFSPPAFGGTKRLLPGRMQETSSSCKSLSESLEDTVELLCLASRSFVASD
jgi:hypothetical protein